MPGNAIYIRGAGSNFPSSSDYTKTTHTIAVNGDTTNGYVKWIGENGRPRISIDGLYLHQSNRTWFENIYMFATAANNLATHGFVHGSSNVILNCVFDLNDKNGCALFFGVETIGFGSRCWYNEIFSKASAPTAQSSARGIMISTYGLDIRWNNIHHCGDSGIEMTGGAAILSQNTIHHCKDAGIHISGALDTSMATVIANNTIDANEGHGIDIDSAAALSQMNVTNNIISNQSGASKNGLDVTGTLATNDRLKGVFNYNAFYGNTGNYSGISAGANDITGTDPGYTDAANGDYRIGTGLKAAAFPTGDFQHAPSGSRTFLDMGALQREEAGGAAGGMIVHPGMDGGLRG